MRAKLEGLAGENKIRESFDMIEIVKSIKGLTYQFDGQTYHGYILRIYFPTWGSDYYSEMEEAAGKEDQKSVAMDTGGNSGQPSIPTSTQK
jgi:hypothetical protein